MREITTKVYKFEELEPSIQEKILNNWDAPNYGWWDSVYEDAAQIRCKIQGFDIDRENRIDFRCEYPTITTAESIISEHGESCGTYHLAKEFLSQIDRLHVKRERMQEIADRYYWRDCLREADSDLEDEIDELEKEFIYSLGEEYLSILRQEYEYQTSREYILEEISSNYFEFYENGDIA